MVAPFSISCANHEGAGKFAVMQWDGEKFEPITDLITPIKNVVRPMLEEAAKKYAESNSPWPGRNNIPCN